MIHAPIYRENQILDETSDISTIVAITVGVKIIDVDVRLRNPQKVTRTVPGNGARSRSIQAFGTTCTVRYGRNKPRVVQSCPRCSAMTKIVDRCLPSFPLIAPIGLR